MLSKLISDIVNLEWQQFTNTNNIGKRAVCQDQKGNFFASRKAYFSIYGENILKSYYCDMKNSIENNQNLVANKYAYMMKYTDFDYYKKIERLVPILSDEKQKIVDSIMVIYMFWENENMSSNIELQQNRPLYSKYDTKNSTSVETYMRGEFSSYSSNTLELILQFFIEKLKEKVNPLKLYLDKLNSYFIQPKDNFSCSSLKSDTNLDMQCPKIDQKSHFFDGNLNLRNSSILASIALKIAKSLDLAVVISIVDNNGNLIVYQRMDNSLLASIQLSINKAKTAVFFKSDTQKLSKNESLKTLYSFNLCDFYSCFLGGGVPVVHNNKIVGAIGVSGGTVEEDVKIAIESVKEFIENKY